MATLFHKKGSPFWWTAYFDATGKRRYRSTGRRQKTEAVSAAADMERRAKRQTPEDDDQRRRILRLVEEAGDMALKGTLTQAAATAIIGRLAETATGEGFRQPGIEEWFRGWLKEKKGARSEGTGERYEGIVDKFIESLPAARRSLPLGVLTMTDIQRFRDAMLEEGRIASTVNGMVRVVRLPLRVALRQGLIVSNPAEAVEMMKEEKAEKGTFTPEQISLLLGTAQPELRGAVLAGYYTGGRAGDISNLKWSSVDLERKTVGFVQRKTGRAVDIPIHPELENWLSEAMARKTTKHVFPGFAGRKSGSGTGLSSKFSALMEAVGISPEVTAAVGDKGRDRLSLSFHSLRHSFNSAMANAGIPQEVRQKLTGHASKAVNDIYTHTDLETLRNAVLSVSGVIRADEAPISESPGNSPE